MESTRKPKVWFLSGWYPTRVHDTLGNFVARHASAVAQNAEVVVLHVCVDPQLPRGQECTVKEAPGFTEMICYLGRPALDVPIYSRVHRYLQIRKAYRRLAAKAVECYGKPEIIHANVFYPITSIAHLMSRLYAIPFVVTEHWTAFLPEDPIRLSRRQLSLSRRMAKRAACIMPVSEHLANAMRSLGLQGNYRVVSNVVDTDLFRLSDKRELKGPFRLMHISTLHEVQKNFNGLMNALSLLRSKRSDFELHVISDGDHSPYKARVEALGLTAQVQFHGKLSSGEVATYLADANLLLLFSRYENFPCVIPEAFACGVPVISTDVGGISEHLSAERGCLVGSEDEQGFANAIDTCLDRLSDFDPAAIRAYAIKHFSYDIIGKQFLEIYNQVIKPIVP
jgi:glycosyltransferase involved in cell wall biosynthesis